MKMKKIIATVIVCVIVRTDGKVIARVVNSVIYFRECFQIILKIVGLRGLSDLLAMIRLQAVINFQIGNRLI